MFVISLAQRGRRGLSGAKRLHRRWRSPTSIFEALKGRIHRMRREKNAMTTGTNRIMDEFAKLMTDAAG
ncbi:hypothetical protein ACE04B_15510, partial [Rhizobium phaseoli]